VFTDKQLLLALLLFTGLQYITSQKT